MKLLALSFMLLLISCGDKGGGSSRERSTQSAQSDKCPEHFAVTSDHTEIAVRASEIALTCGLSEEELVKLAQADLRL